MAHNKQTRNADGLRSDREWDRISKRCTPPVIADDGTVSGDGFTADLSRIADVHGSPVIEENAHAFAAWAPVTAINEEAHVVLLLDPMTEGDGNLAIAAARAALHAGSSGAEALAAGTRAADLYGTKRDTVVRMLDAIGLPEVLGVPSTAAMWGDRSDLLATVHVGVYPIFGGEDEPWDSDTDHVYELLEDLRYRTTSQLRRVRAFRERKALLVPMGRHARKLAQHLLIDELLAPTSLVLDVPYPSVVYQHEIEQFVSGTRENADLPRLVARDHVEGWAAGAGMARQ